MESVQNKDRGITDQETVVVLGAGVTGLTTAWELVRGTHYKVIVLERASSVGGLASTASAHGFQYDSGSHRLHAECDSYVYELLRDICGEDLLTRERNGRIYLNGATLRYPPTALDIVSSFGGPELLRFAAQWIFARTGSWLCPRE